MKLKGSITIWVCLSVFLVCQVVMVFVEAARKSEIARVKQLEVNQNMESVFASYKTPLWERYHILGWDEQKVDYQMMVDVNREYSKRYGRAHFLEAAMMEEYEWSRMLITDQGGLPYRKHIAAYMKGYWKYQSVNDNQSNSEKIAELEKESGGSPDYYLGLLRCSSPNGPIKLMSSILQEGFFEYAMLGNSIQISHNKMDKRTCLESRKRNTGNLSMEDTLLLAERGLFIQYLYTNFGNFREVKEQTAMQYEWEYLLCGGESDYENLLSVTARLLAVRIAANTISIYQDSQKVEQAELYATALAALCLEPDLVEVYKPMILTSWAFAESMLDLRSILQGEKVPLIKNSQEWTIQQYLLCETYFWMGAKAKNCENGLTYEDYLQALLLMVSDEKLSYRAMDLQEKTIQQMEGNEDFQMDNMVVAAQVNCGYQVKYWILPMVSLLGGNIGKGYVIHCKESYSYIYE